MTALDPENTPLLPRGITGFWSVREEAPPEILEELCFRQLCYAAARELRGRVLQIDTDLTVRNFYWAHLQLPEARLYLLENVCYPYLAWAEALERGRIAFADPPVRFRPADWSVRLLTAAQLAQDWRGLCRDLSPAELRQIQTEQPRTVGEIVFNFWD